MTPMYADTSVLLRWVLGESGALPRPGSTQMVLSSQLATVEAPRTLDRLRRQGRLTDAAYAERHGVTVRLLDRLHLVHLSSGVLRRAADPFPTPLRTLDALHLATALLIRDARHRDLIFATHDTGLAAAADSVGFDVRG